MKRDELIRILRYSRDYMDTVETILEQAKIPRCSHIMRGEDCAWCELSENCLGLTTAIQYLSNEHNPI